MPHVQTSLVSLYGKINNTLIYSNSFGTMHSNLQWVLSQWYTYLNIYADGMRDSSLTNTGKPFHGTTSQLLMLNITQYNETMAGEYTIVIKLHCTSRIIYPLILTGCDSAAAAIDYFHKICYSFHLYYGLLDLVKEVSITTFGGFIIIVLI